VAEILANPSKDRELLIRLQEGDLEALGGLFDRHRQMVYRTALAVTSDESAAADLVQDTFLRLYRFASRVDPMRPLEPWLYRVTTNLAYTWLKKRKRWWKAIKDMAEWLSREKRPSPEPTYQNNEDWQMVQQAIAGLPNAQRVVIVSYYINDLSIQEISEIFSIPVGTVKSRLHYGRKTLKKKLGLHRDMGKGVFA
jgi:RNA polymerase sigma-70 factor (ECF subfamily)